MSLPQSIFLSTLVMAIAIITSSYAPVEAQARRAGYMVASDGRQFVWRVNTSDGTLTYCSRFNNSASQAAVERDKPFCSSPAAPNH